MTRLEIKQHNQTIIMLVTTWHKTRRGDRFNYRRFNMRPPRLGYKEMAEKLNAGNVQTSCGHPWTFRSLYRMMQRQRVRLIDIVNGHFYTP